MTPRNTKRLGALALAAIVRRRRLQQRRRRSTAPATAARGRRADDGRVAPRRRRRAPAPSSGTIIVSGSSTVEPISTGVAEAFKRQRTRTSATPSTARARATASRSFCAGETDITDASRKIKDEEAADSAPPPASSTSSSRSRSTASSVLTSLDNTAVDLPVLRRPVRAGRPRVDRLRQVDRRPGARHRARLHARPSRTPT